MTGKEDAVHVEGFALEPVGGREQVHDARNLTVFVGRDLHADTLVLDHREQVIDDIETLRACRVVHRGHVEESGELAVGVIAQKCEYRHNGADLRNDGQFPICNIVRDNRIPQLCTEMVAKVFQALVHQSSLETRDR